MFLDSLNHLQVMCMFIPFLVEDACLVKIVDADLAGGVDDMLCVEHHAHVCDVAFFVAEKGQVAWLDFRQEIHQLPFGDLLGGIPREELACRTGAELHKAAAVNAEDAATTP